MEAVKNDGTSSPVEIKKFEIGSDKMINEVITQLEASFELGLAGLREYLNQLTPDDREKIISTIRNNIQNF